MKKLMIVFTFLLFLTGCNALFDADGCRTGFHMQEGICVEDFDGEGSFTSGDDVLSLYHTFNKRQNLVNERFGMRFFGGDVAMEWAQTDASEAFDDNSAKGSDDYSETNNQVEGVDEMDNVLTDGKYIYIQNYNKIQIILAYTIADEYEVLEIVKEIELDDYKPEEGWFNFNGMYVDEDRLIVVGTSHNHTCLSYQEEKYEDEVEHGDSEVEREMYCQQYDYHTYTHVYEYSKEDFELDSEYTLSGYFVGSRKINDDLYFVTNEYIPFYWAEQEDFVFDIDMFLPEYTVDGTKVTIPYSEITYIDGTQPSNFTTFFGIDLDDGSVSTEVVLGEGGYNLYVSTENIYLTGTIWNWNHDFLIALEEADDVDEVEEEEPYEIQTSIIRMEISNGVVEYGATGEVPGMALDQFAMDERNDYVRIVTTSNNWWWWWGTDQEINNRLMVLDLDLNIVSTLEGLGKPGESVQSTRFVGDYAYVVTFLRTDPFYVIDLSDPENPVTLDELEIPGFSAYLQPIGENYMLGIGHDADEEGRTTGLKISLYDISDKSNAVVADEIIYDYSDNSHFWTSTLWNHKDLLVSIDKGIIAMPYTEYSWGNETDDWRWEYNSGVLVLNLDIENGEISERGRVEHSEANYHDIYVYKSKFISNYLYTISSKYIKVSTIDNPETILNSLQIGESRHYYYEDGLSD